MSEFKVYDKKPVPFTDANMDIPRGINDVQAYYVIAAEELENSGKANLEEALRDSLTQNTTVETFSQVDPRLSGCLIPVLIRSRPSGGVRRSDTSRSA